MCSTSLGVALGDRNGAVLVAPPGAGKTTVVPLWLLEQHVAGHRRVVMLEPRRLATRAAAHRMASLIGEPVGGIVGYQTRDERRIGRSTRIEVVTEGVLTRRLQHDPELPGVGIVIFDEVHERNLPTDLGLALALDARAALRPDLRILAMSATPDSAQLARVLGNDADGPVPIVQSDGRQHPVDIRSLPLAKGMRIEPAVAEAIVTALRQDDGDVLVFLPGVGEIRRVQSLLDGRLSDEVDVYPLAGALSLAEQDLALQPSPTGRRRVVLSTDIAESSLTVAGVRIVVDAGLARVPRFDVRTGMSRLTTVTTSRASADQRAGRAGRTEPGVCYRLWGKLEQSTRLAHLPAEITQVELADLVLELAAWHAQPTELCFLDPPPPKAMQVAQQLLRMLDALDGDGAITEAGPSDAGAAAASSIGAHGGRVDARRSGRWRVSSPRSSTSATCCAAAPTSCRATSALRVRLVAGDTRDDRADRRGCRATA